MNAKSSTGLKRHTLTHGLLLWLLAGSIVAAATYLSASHFLDQEWLSRAGCLIVVIGISSGFAGLVQEKVLLESLRLRRRMSTAAIQRRYRRSTEERDKRITELHKAFDERIATLQHDLKISVGLLEASLLLTGTLLWGFGDLTKYLFP